MTDSLLEQIQSLIKALEAGSYNAAPGQLVGGGPLIDEGELKKWPKISCSHEWTTYVGFTDTYEYCKTCDEKKT